MVDPNKPKGPKGAYMCFVQVARPKINAAHPDLKFAEIAKMLGEQWKTMDAPTRASYEKMAEADKARYQADIAAYVPMDAAGLEELRKVRQTDGQTRGWLHTRLSSSAFIIIYTVFIFICLFALDFFQICFFYSAETCVVDSA